MKNITLLVFVLTSSLLNGQSSQAEFFRHLRYNHVSPIIELVFVHPIERSIAENSSHYVVERDSKGRIEAILNNHYQTEKKHPLASIGAYEVFGQS